MKNPAEKTTVRPNQNPKLILSPPRIKNGFARQTLNGKELIGRFHAVMKAGFILITHRRPGFDCGTKFLDDANRKTDLMPCNPQVADR